MARGASSSSSPIATRSCKSSTRSETRSRVAAGAGDGSDRSPGVRRRACTPWRRTRRGPGWAGTRPCRRARTPPGGGWHRRRSAVSTPRRSPCPRPPTPEARCHRHRPPSGPPTNSRRGVRRWHDLPTAAPGAILYFPRPAAARVGRAWLSRVGGECDGILSSGAAGYSQAGRASAPPPLPTPPGSNRRHPWRQGTHPSLRPVLSRRRRQFGGHFRW
jgi:hypothetical protein